MRRDQILGAFARVGRGLLEDQHPWVIVDAERLLGALVGDLHAQDIRVRGDLGDQREAQVAVKQAAVVVHQRRVAHTQACRAGVDPVARQGDIVGLVELIEHPLFVHTILVIGPDILTQIVLRVRWRADPEVGTAPTRRRCLQGQRVVPDLRQHLCARRSVISQPACRDHPRVRLRVDP